VGRSEITPPVGIYHRFWGAAAHDRAAGVHRRLFATALLLEPDGGEPAERTVLVAVDHCLLRPAEMESVSDETARLAGLDRSRITIVFSHTHSGGHIARSRAQLPGGELIEPYLQRLPALLAEAINAAIRGARRAVLTYATAYCDMGRNRDYHDAERAIDVCGFNPDDPDRRAAGYPVHVVRIVDARHDNPIATVVNYPCHPTTLAWDNALISPDYIGALRETVEEATEAPCVFLLAPCGDVGPRHGFVGDTEAADRNGRQVAYAALSALESMPPPATDPHYAGPVISGATIGTWEHRPLDESRRRKSGVFRRRLWNLELDYRSDLPGLTEAEAELRQRQQNEEAARARHDDAEAARQRAMVERQRRLIERVAPLPAGRYPYALDVRQVGDAFWIVLEGEPYHAVQRALEERFAGVPIVCATLANGSRCSYLPRREDYARPLYQVEVSLLAPGSLEQITEEIGRQIERWRND